MDDLDKSELLTEQLETSTATTRELPRILPGAHDDEDEFRAGQSNILEMISSNAPLSEILTSLVLMIESQSEEMLCSAAQRRWQSHPARSSAEPSGELCHGD